MAPEGGEKPEEPAMDPEQSKPEPEVKPGAYARVAKPLTAADVRRLSADATRTALAEERERASLIEGNRARMDVKMAAELYRQPLSVVKAMVAALPVAPPEKKLDERAARVTVDPVGGGDGAAAPVNPDTAALVRRINRSMGLEKDEVPAIELDQLGTLRLSHVSRQPFDLNMVASLQKAANPKGE
jgi:hypothetical protein